VCDLIKFSPRTMLVNARAGNLSRDQFTPIIRDICTMWIGLPHRIYIMPSTWSDAITRLDGVKHVSFYSFGNDVHARAHAGPINFNRYTFLSDLLLTHSKRRSRIDRVSSWLFEICNNIVNGKCKRYDYISRFKQHV